MNLLKSMPKLTPYEQQALVRLLNCYQEVVSLHTLPLFSKEKAIKHLRDYLHWVDTPTGRRIYRKLYPWWWVQTLSTIGVVMWVLFIVGTIIFGIVQSVLSILNAN